MPASDDFFASNDDSWCFFSFAAPIVQGDFFTGSPQKSSEYRKVDLGLVRCI